MPPIAAIFDLDDTLLNAASARLLARYSRQNDQFSRYFRRRDSLAIAAAVLTYRLGLLDATQLMARSARIAKDIALDEFWPLVQQWFDEMVVHHISARGQEQLAWHRAQGHIPVICSGSSQFSVQPVAHYLAIEHMVYTEWLDKDGRLTGEIRRPIVYGTGKVHWMQQWAERHHIVLSDSYFYSDDISDRPLLETVAHPAAVNPDRQLTQLAAQRGWPILHWR